MATRVVTRSGSIYRVEERKDEIVVVRVKPEPQEEYKGVRVSYDYGEPLWLYGENGKPVLKTSAVVDILLEGEGK